MIYNYKLILTKSKKIFERKNKEVEGKYPNREGSENLKTEKFLLFKKFLKLLIEIVFCSNKNRAKQRTMKF